MGRECLGGATAGRLGTGLEHRCRSGRLQDKPMLSMLGSGRQLEIRPFYMNQAMAWHVCCRLRLFQHDVSDQWLVNSVFRFPIEEENFAVNGIKPLDFDLKISRPLANANR
jgi:hypothetical protein